MSTGRILITGGAGFIGSHLADRFLSLDYQVVVVDNLISGSKDNISHLTNNPNFTFVEHDITLPLPQAITEYDYQAILHFATPASPNPSSPVSYMSHPVETMMVTSLGTKNILDLAKKSRSQVILASTSEVYGDPLVHPQVEDYRGNVSCTGPRACYDEGKRFMEAISMVYYRQFNLPVKIIRIFNTYGPRMRLDDGRFTIGLIKSVVKNEPFAIFGNGEATRSFCYIDDLISGIIKVFNSSKLVGQVINLGNPTELSLNQAIEIFEKVIGKQLDKKDMPQAIDDPKKRQPDITKAKQLLSWEPIVNFAEGMQKTLAYYQK